MRHYRLLERALVIAPACRQPFFLSYKREHPEADILLMTVEQLEDLLRYHHDNRAVRYLIEQGKGYKEAKDILKALAYMNLQKAYSSPRLQKLQEIATELAAKGYLYKDEYAHRVFLNRNIVLDGYHSGARISFALDNVPNLTMDWFPQSRKRENKPRIAEFSNLYEELHYVCNRIANDISNGVSPNDIYLSGYNEEYRLTLSLMAEAYHFSVDFPALNSLYETKMGGAFLSECEQSEQLDEASMKDILESLRSRFGNQEGFNKIVQLAFGLLCAGLSKEKQIQIYEEALKEEDAPRVRIENAVRILNEDFPIDGAHIYRIDFNINNSPHVSGDNDYLFDEEKEELGMMTSRKMNIEAKDKLLAFLDSTCIQSVSYHARHLNQSKNPSSLMASEAKYVNKDSPFLVEFKPKLDYEFSKEFAALWGTSLLDNLEQFGINSPETDYLKNTLDLGKTIYSGDFQPFEESKNANGKLVLSASSLDSFFKCPFHYYCSYLLKIDDSESTFSALVGTIFHAVLERFYDADFDPKASYAKAISDQEAKCGVPFTPREHVLLDNLYEFLARDIAFLQEHDELMHSPDNNGKYPPAYLREFRKTVEVAPNLYLTGSADKIILTEGPSGEYATFVDYKTYSKKFAIKTIDYGFSLQLPLYAFLASKLDEFDGKRIEGLFISPILPNMIHGSDNKTLEESRRKELKLEGVFLDDHEGLYTLDYNWMSSTIIASCSYGKNGFRKDNTHVISQATMDRIVEVAESKIVEAASLIRDGAFEICSTSIKNGESGCDFCPFRDVCFRRLDQMRFINLKSEEDGGEENA